MYPPEPRPSDPLRGDRPTDPPTSTLHEAEWAVFLSKGEHMNSEENGREFSLRDLIRLITVALAVGAVIKELRKPAEERTWTGDLFEFVPYDFRKPSLDKVKATMWNPEGPLIAPRVFGVGWTLNAGAAVERIKMAAGRGTTETAST